MSAVVRGAFFAPFRVRSFRFQWPADVSTSWAMEMETLILGWYVLVETDSVLVLTVFASLHHIGTLLSPMFGVMGDRFGQRKLLLCTRGLYLSVASTIMVLALTDLVTPMVVLMLAAITGLVRPSDIGARTALIGATMPQNELIGAMAIQRTTQDSARIFGALTGAGVMATLGMGPAYVVVVCFYLTSVILTSQVGGRRAPPAADAPPRPSPWRELKAGLSFVWHAPMLRALMIFAFVLNATAFPLHNSLMPYVAKEIYLADQTLLGTMVAITSSGALFGAIMMGRLGSRMQPGRWTLLAGAYWFVCLLVFSQISNPAFGLPVLFLAGIGQAASTVPIAALLLRNSGPEFHGRIMGIRMLCIYGNVPGLLLAGPLIANLGYPFTAGAYCLFGIVFTAAFAFLWREQLWRLDATSNRK